MAYRFLIRNVPFRMQLPRIAASRTGLSTEHMPCTVRLHHIRRVGRTRHRVSRPPVGRVRTSRRRRLRKRHAAFWRSRSFCIDRHRSSCSNTRRRNKCSDTQGNCMASYNLPEGRSRCQPASGPRRSPPGRSIDWMDTKHQRRNHLDRLRSFRHRTSLQRMPGTPLRLRGAECKCRLPLRPRRWSTRHMGQSTPSCSRSPPHSCRSWRTWSSPSKRRQRCRST